MIKTISLISAVSLSMAMAQSAREFPFFTFLKEEKLLKSFVANLVKDQKSLSRSYVVTTLPLGKNKDNPIFTVTLTQKGMSGFINKVNVVAVGKFSNPQASFGYNFGGILGGASTGCLGLSQNDLNLFSKWIDEVFATLATMNLGQKTFTKTFGPMNATLAIKLSTSDVTFNGTIENAKGTPGKNNWPYYCTMIQK